MPLVSYKNAKFIQNEMTGICVPDEVVNRYHPEMSREEGEEVAVSLVEELTGKMKDLADGFYFMLPFNRVSIMEKYAAVRSRANQQ
jgi:homocysteine S-methyltransferase